MTTDVSMHYNIMIMSYNIVLAVDTDDIVRYYLHAMEVQYSPERRSNMNV